MSRIDSIIQRYEAGEPIDWRREATLLALELLRQDERFVDSAIERDRQADDQFANSPARSTDSAR